MSNATTARIPPKTVAQIGRIAHILGLPAHRSKSTVIVKAVEALHEKLEADQPEREIDAEAFKLLLGENTQVVIEVDKDGFPKVQRGALEYRDHVPFVRTYGPLDGATVMVEHEQGDDRWRVFLRPTGTLAGFRLYAGTVPSIPRFRTVETVGTMRTVVDPKLTDSHLSETKETPDDNR